MGITGFEPTEFFVQPVKSNEIAYKQFFDAFCKVFLYPPSFPGKNIPLTKILDTPLSRVHKSPSSYLFDLI
jgi:hypothetical protein